MWPISIKFCMGHQGDFFSIDCAFEEIHGITIIFLFWFFGSTLAEKLVLTPRRFQRDWCFKTRPKSWPIMFVPEPPNCFQIIKIHSFSKKYQILSLTDTILIIYVIFSSPHDIVLSLCCVWGRQKKFRGRKPHGGWGVRHLNSKGSWPPGGAKN